MVRWRSSCNSDVLLKYNFNTKVVFLFLELKSLGHVHIIISSREILFYLADEPFWLKNVYIIKLRLYMTGSLIYTFIFGCLIGLFKI